MSHATGKVQFRDGEVKFFEYDATTSYVCPRLYDSRDEMDENWRGDNRRECPCKEREFISIAVDYGNGIQWQGEACKKHMAITEGFTPYGDEVLSWDGLPDWWKDKE